MGLFPDLKQAFDNLTKPNKKPAIQEPDQTKDTFTAQLDATWYSPEKENWFKAMPYGFKFRNRKGVERVMFLPISPQNLTITTHYATNVITTLYGTVEEHSEQRYFDILIEGTTGIMPRYTAPIHKDSVENIKSNSSTGRARYDDSTGHQLSISANLAGGFFSKTIGTINNVLGKAQDIINGKDSMDISGVNDQNKTGYMAFHRLNKFFLEYKADASGVHPLALETSNDRRIRSGADSSSHPLSFLNYKDGNMYDVAIQKFTLRRSANSPMLYNYSIVLRAYNLRSIANAGAQAGDLPGRLSTLGLDGVQSSTLLSEISETTSGVKQVVGGLLGGINILGG
ncbi:MAG: hypothetical protein DRQ89_12810 [Epsilonproteobacteria bacterium]|nr:MAG: hypothetical protein DRQ89_12810 [Campylobacterota bacterium]